MSKRTIKKTVVAQMTIERANQPKLVVQVFADSDFHQFYHWFQQDGRKRKVFLRASNRNDGITPHWRAAFQTPGLDVLAKRQADVQAHVTRVTIKVLRKRRYQALLTCSPADLHLPTAAQTVQILAARKGIPVVFPEGYIPLQKRMDILTGVTR